MYWCVSLFGVNVCMCVGEGLCSSFATPYPFVLTNKICLNQNGTSERFFLACSIYHSINTSCQKIANCPHILGRFATVFNCLFSVISLFRLLVKPSISFEAENWTHSSRALRLAILQINVAWKCYKVQSHKSLVEEDETQTCAGVHF